MRLFSRPSRGLFIVAVVTVGVASLAARGGGGSATTVTATQVPVGDQMSGMTAAGMGGMSMQMHLLGSQTWQGMKIELASMAPQPFTLFEGTQAKEVKPTAADNIHLMAVLSDAQTHERIPYANCWVTIKDKTDKIVFDERLWPMISRDMGTHYGINAALPGPGDYTAILRVGAPQAARHPAYAKIWLTPHTVTMPLHWTGK